MIRRFFRHLGESIKNLKRNLLSTLTAVFSVMIVLSLLGVFGSVQQRGGGGKLSFPAGFVVPPDPGADEHPGNQVVECHFLV